MDNLLIELCEANNYVHTMQLLNETVERSPAERKLHRFRTFKTFRKRAIDETQLSFEINLDEDEKKAIFPKMEDSIKRRKTDAKLQDKKVKIPSKFIKHVLSLGFNHEDASRLYEQKDDWLGISSGGKLLCTQKGCNFSTSVASDELFKHCRVAHDWRDYPCTKSNCNFVAYCSFAFKQHSMRFHSKLVSRHNLYPCTKPTCNAGFKDRYLRRMHENIHDNNLLNCVFCPYTTVEHYSLTCHQRVHFNIRDYECDICGMRFSRRSNLNNHFKQRHSGVVTKCLSCKYESSPRNVQKHLRRTHGITASRWDAKNQTFIVPTQN